MPATNWENIRTLSISGGTTAYSDGYGQHLVGKFGTNTVKHYLLDNNGNVMFSAPFPGLSGGDSSSVTSYGGRVSVVVDVGDVLKLYQSANGGESWGFTSEAPVGVTINRLDAYADQWGVHIVWDNTLSDKVYYVRYRSESNDWFGFKHVTDLGGNGLTPKVVTSVNKAHVGFKGYSSSGGRSRDLYLPTEQWDNFYRDVPRPMNAGPAVTQSISLAGDVLHMVFLTDIVYPGTGAVFSSKRDINGSWLAPVYVGTGRTYWESGNYRRKVATTAATTYTTYLDPNNGILVHAYNQQCGWSGFFQAEGFTGTNEQRYPMVSVSKTGIYVFWNGTYPTSHQHMRRRWVAMQGNISENSFWTGDNWVSGDLSIQAGVQVRLKPGSVTYISDNAHLIVQSGATMVMEPGSQLKFGIGASLVCYGQLFAVGTATTQVTFTSTSPSGTWSGIVLSGSGANGSVLQYATVERVLTYGGAAVSILGAYAVHVEHCMLSNNDASNGTNGIYLGAGSFAYISNNAISGHGGSG
ncbi:MAG: hypothetical protein AAB393_04540, partial [Bacteroidota bacterium]